MPGLNPSRADIIVAGLAVTAELLKRVNGRGLTVSAFGLREGLLLDMAGADPVPASHDPMRLVREFGAEHRVLLAAERERNRADVLDYAGPWGASARDCALFWILHRLPGGGRYTPRVDAFQVPVLRCKVQSRCVVLNLAENHDDSQMLVLRQNVQRAHAILNHENAEFTFVNELAVDLRFMPESKKLYPPSGQGHAELAFVNGLTVDDLRMRESTEHDA